MRIVHLITGMAEAAGTSVFVAELSAELARVGHDVAIVVKNRCEKECAVDAAIEVRCCPNAANVDLAGVDVVHIHALWDPWLTQIGKGAKSAGAKIVWSPHGMLTTWALGQKRLKKWIAMALYQKAALRAADILHVTAQSEVDDVRRLGLGNSIVVAPLGVRLPKENVNFSCLPSLSPRIRTILFLSRVQKKKGLITLMDAWARVDRTGWRIVIAGPSQEGHIEEVLARAQEHGVKDSVEYVGPVFGEEKDKLYAESDLFVLPTFSENFGSVVIEALAASVPVITTKGAPWEELEKCKCGRWIDIGVEPLVTVLREMMGLSDKERMAMGERGRKLVEDKYTWPAIGKQMSKEYARLIKSMNSNG